jgi:hypothetical protein
MFNCLTCAKVILFFEICKYIFNFNISLTFEDFTVKHASGYAFTCFPTAKVTIIHDTTKYKVLNKLKPDKKNASLFG